MNAEYLLIPRGGKMSAVKGEFRGEGELKLVKEAT